MRNKVKSWSIFWGKKWILTKHHNYTTTVQHTCENYSKLGFLIGVCYDNICITHSGIQNFGLQTIKNHQKSAQDIPSTSLNKFTWHNFPIAFPWQHSKFSLNFYWYWISAFRSFQIVWQIKSRLNLSAPCCYMSTWSSA